MRRSLRVCAVCTFTLTLCVLGHAQETPSLGDLARQAQKDKTSAPVKKVFTNDDIAASPSFGASRFASGPGGGAGRVMLPGVSGQPGASASSADELGRMESFLNQLDSLDRATLAKNILQGSDVNFPGRAKWEEDLFAAKQVFVARGRDIMKRATQLDASATSVRDVKNPNDPRAKDLNYQLQELVQQATRAGTAFQTVIAEGKNLAGQSESH